MHAILGNAKYEYKFQDASQAFFIKMTTTDDKEAVVSKSTYRQN
jgi:hypothetical protein